MEQCCGRGDIVSQYGIYFTDLIFMFCLMMIPFTRHDDKLLRPSSGNWCDNMWDLKASHEAITIAYQHLPVQIVDQ